MKERTIYIPPNSENYTGYTTSTLMGTSTSELSTFRLMDDKVFYKLDQAGDESKEYTFPESREERFLDRNLLEFYTKKGYKT